MTERENLARGTFGLIELGVGVFTVRTVTRAVDDQGVMHTYVTDRQLGNVASLTLTLLAEKMPGRLWISGYPLDEEP